MEVKGRCVLTCSVPAPHGLLIGVSAPRTAFLPRGDPHCDEAGVADGGVGRAARGGKQVWKAGALSQCSETCTGVSGGTKNGAATGSRGLGRAGHGGNRTQPPTCGRIPRPPHFQPAGVLLPPSTMAPRLLGPRPPDGKAPGHASTCAPVGLSIARDAAHLPPSQAR